MGRIGGIVLANKRMFSVDVTETDAFLEMPLTAQALYFHLGMRGDDDGFVSNPRSIVRVSGCSESDLVTLAKSACSHKRLPDLKFYIPSAHPSEPQYSQ